MLPTAFSGIVTGILLGLARVMGETAPLLILGPYTKSIATDLFGGLMPTLPTMINQDRTELARRRAVDRVWAAALTLILLVLVLNLAGRLVGRGFGSVNEVDRHTRAIRTEPMAKRIDVKDLERLLRRLQGRRGRDA